MSNSITKYEDDIENRIVSALQLEYNLAAKEVKFQVGFIFDEDFDIDCLEVAIENLKKIQNKLKK